ncbi:MAG: hypothetical protein U0894_10160 [Pirellulales bacterium]
MAWVVVVVSAMTGNTTAADNHHGKLHNPRSDDPSCRSQPSWRLNEQITIS